MADAGKKFALQLEAFAKKAGERANAAVREIIIALDENLVKRSPVGNRELWAANIKRAEKGLPPLPVGYVGGHFRHSWQYGNWGGSGIPMNELEGTANDSVERVTAQLAGVPDMATKHILINNTPYAMELERGHSGQAPEGIVGLAVVEFTQIVAEAVAKAKE